MIINNSNTTLHLFSNILDVEFFRLDRGFLEKISSSQKGLNYFVCVSPNINDKRNARLDMFYRYFDEHFETELISDRSDDIGKYKRYEKVFKTYIPYVYTQNWNRISTQIKTKKEYRCESCGFKAPDNYHKKFIHTHHINGDKQNNTMDNLKVLCIKCHSDVDIYHKRIKSSENYREFVSKYNLE